MDLLKQDTYPFFNDTSTCAASLIQLEFWLIHEFEPDSSAYNIPSVSLIKGDIHFSALDSAINMLLRRYPIFRTVFTIDDTGKVMQHAKPWSKIDLPITDLQPSTSDLGDENIVRQAISEEILKPFDLASGPPIRFRLYRSDEPSYLLVITAHHIVFDLITKDLFAKELGNEYRRALTGETDLDADQQSDYASFAAWQDSWVQSSEGKLMEEKWHRYLEGVETELDLPSDQPPFDGSPDRYLISPVPVKFSDETLEKIQVFCHRENIPPYLVLLASWALTLARHSGQTKFCVGVPMTNRRKDEFKNTMGCFVNSLPLFFDVSDNPTFLEALRRVRKGLLLMHRMQEIPYFHLVQMMRSKGIIVGNSLYQAGFTFEHPMQLSLDGLCVKPLYIQPGYVQLDLFATFWHETDTIVGVIKYNSGKFEARTVEHIKKHLLQAANEICEHPQRNVEHFTLISATDRSLDKKHVVPGKYASEENLTKDEEASLLAIAATFTAEFLQEFLTFWFERLDLRLEAHFAPFNQVFQELLNPSSLLRSNPKGYNAIMVRFEDLIDKEKMTPRNSGQTSMQLSQVLEELKQAVSNGVRGMKVPLCFILCPPSPLGRELENLASEAIAGFLKEMRSIPGVTLLTYEEIDCLYHVSDYHEPIGETVGFIPFTRNYLAALSTALVRSLHSLSQKPIKALAVDCDGTLWQGVVGEDGPTGVAIGPWQRAFQEFLLKQYEAGVILCLCSKNNEADVWSVFEQNPDMLLRREHISFWKINWEAKSRNISTLVKEMNIGMDAVAFLDDNPLERAEVGLRLPSIFCVEFPDAWEERSKWLEHVWLLDHHWATAEDKKRQKHYRSEQIRDSLKQNVGSFSEFLEKLELKIDINHAEEADYDRLAQLSVRTNQFNTTTLRLTPQEVAEYATRPGMSAHVARVRDRFGDYGLVGAMLAREAEESFHVDGMFLSCRALGRNVEYQMASYLAAKANQAGCTEIIFLVRETDRNEPARNFLSHLNKLCGGTRDNEDGLHLNSEQLSEFSFEMIPSSEETPNSTVAQDTANVINNSAVQNRAAFVKLANELNSAEAILHAVEQKPPGQQEINISTKSETLVTAPETKTEQVVADVWKRVLGLRVVNTHSNFFEVGGTSLLMVRIAIELKNKNGLEVTITDMFQYPTIADLARYVNQKGQVGDIPGRVISSAVRQRDALSSKNLPASFKRLKQVRK